MKPTQVNGTSKVPVIKPLAMMMYREMRLSLHVLLTLTIHEGEWSASCPGCFNSWQKASSIQWTEGWVALGLIRSISIPSSHQTSLIQLVALCLAFMLGLSQFCFGKLFVTVLWTN